MSRPRSKKSPAKPTPVAIAANTAAELIAQAVEVSADDNTRKLFALLGTIASVDRRGYRKLRTHAWNMLADSEGKGRKGTELRREWLASKAGGK